MLYDNQIGTNYPKSNILIKLTFHTKFGNCGNVTVKCVIFVFCLPVDVVPTLCIVTIHLFENKRVIKRHIVTGACSSKCKLWTCFCISYPQKAHMQFVRLLVADLRPFHFQIDNGNQ